MTIKPITIDNDNKTICIIGPFPPPLYGQSVAVRSLAESPLLHERYNIVKIDYAYKWSSCKIFTSLYKVVKCWKMLRNLKKAIRQHRISIFYLTISSSKQGALRDWLVTKTIAKELGYAKFIIHHHSGNFSSFYNTSDNRCRSRVNYYLSKADRVIVLTPRLRELFDGLISEEKIRVVSNGISVKDVLPDIVVNKRLESLVQRKKIHILYLSNMIRLKGYFKLLQAASLLQKVNIDFNMTFTGVFTNPSERQPFEDYIKENNLEKNVVYRGLVTGGAKVDLLSNNDIFVLPTSLEEGQPISILETMAAGMAIVTTDRGGIPDVVKDQINGIILSDVSPKAIAEAIIQLNNNRELLFRIGKENRKVAKEKYIDVHYVQNMIKVFDSLSNIG